MRTFEIRRMHPKKIKFLILYVALKIMYLKISLYILYERLKKNPKRNTRTKG